MQQNMLANQIELLEQWNGYLNLAQDLIIKIRQAEANQLAGILDHRHRIFKKIEQLRQTYLLNAKSSPLKPYEQAIVDEKIYLLQQRNAEIEITTNKALKILMDKLSKTKIEMASLHKSNKAIKAYHTISHASYALA